VLLKPGDFVLDHGHEHAKKESFDTMTHHCMELTGVATPFDDRAHWLWTHSRKYWAIQQMGLRYLATLDGESVLLDRASSKDPSSRP